MSITYNFYPVATTSSYSVILYDLYDSSQSTSASICLDSVKRRCKMWGGVSLEITGRAESNKISACKSLAKCRATGHQLAIRFPL